MIHGSFCGARKFASQRLMLVFVWGCRDRPAALASTATQHQEVERRDSLILRRQRNDTVQDGPETDAAPTAIPQPEPQKAVLVEATQIRQRQHTLSSANTAESCLGFECRLLAVGCHTGQLDCMAAPAANQPLTGTSRNTTTPRKQALSPPPPQTLNPPRLWMRSTWASIERLATGHRRSGTSS